MKTTIAILGGTGKEGRGLALRWARSGHPIVIGSRDSARAAGAAQELGKKAGGDVQGTTNEKAAALGEIIVVAVPFAAQAATLSSVRAYVGGKVVVDAVVPIDFSARHAYAPPEEGSAAEQAQALLGPAAKVVAALHHVAAHDLERLDHSLEADVLIAGDDPAAKATVADLVRDIGARPVDVGGLRQASAVEAFTTLLVQVNRIHKTKSAGLRITGIDPKPIADATPGR